MVVSGATMSGKTEWVERQYINPIWTGLFARGGGKMPPPNFAISNQTTTKLGKGIL